MGFKVVNVAKMHELEIRKITFWPRNVLQSLFVVIIEVSSAKRVFAMVNWPCGAILA